MGNERLTELFVASDEETELLRTTAEFRDFRLTRRIDFFICWPRFRFYEKLWEQ